MTFNVLDVRSVLELSDIYFKLEFSGQTMITLINHRAKRGGSLFQGGSGEEEGSRSDPSPGGEAPTTPL